MYVGKKVKRWEVKKVSSHGKSKTRYHLARKYIAWLEGLQASLARHSDKESMKL
jgi:hypothetical protein